MTADEIRILTGKSSLTLDELGMTLPGTARLMAEVGPRIGGSWHAAQAGNWDLTRYLFRSGLKVLRTVPIVRPKYQESITAFIDADCRPVLAAIEAGDLEAFNSAFDAMVEAANRYHVEFDKAFIVWRIPPDPPPDLVLEPGGP